MNKEKRNATLLMVLLVVVWGFDYIVAKHALELLPPLTLLFLKYFVGFFVVLLFKLKLDRKALPRKKDIPLFVLCAIFGEIIYYYCEYTSMSYIPVSLVTIILAFVPAFSILIERVIFKRKFTKVMMIGVSVCILGVALVIGVDFHTLFQGRILGYLLAFGAVLSWNAYNFLTASLHEHYTGVTLTLTQLTCTILLTAPYALSNMPSVSEFTWPVVSGIFYLGIISAGIGFQIIVKALHVLGPTPTALFSNFLPITATFFGWLFLQERISILQVCGGIIVIVAACFVIKEKEKMEEKRDE